MDRQVPLPIFRCPGNASSYARVFPDLGSDGSSSQPPKHATARHPFLTAASFGRTHPGGFKPSDARNQDTFFELRIDEHNAGQ